MNTIDKQDNTDTSAGETTVELQSETDKEDDLHEKTVRWQTELAGFAIFNASTIINKLIAANDFGLGVPIDAYEMSFLNSTIQTNATLITDILNEYNEMRDKFTGIHCRLTPPVYVAGGSP